MEELTDSGIVYDLAGNSNSATVSGINIDKIAPPSQALLIELPMEMIGTMQML